MKLRLIKRISFAITLVIGVAAFSNMQAYAMSGSIQITVPQEAKGSIVSFAKVAEREELEEDRVTEWLEKEIEPEGRVAVDSAGIAKIENLQEGVYQVGIAGENGYEFTRALVSIPMWDEEQKSMVYDVSMLPKYSYNPPEIEERSPVPSTGDESKTGIYIGIGLISLIIVAIMSCHNRFKCARMSE